MKTQAGSYCAAVEPALAVILRLDFCHWLPNDKALPLTYWCNLSDMAVEMFKACLT